MGRKYKRKRNSRRRSIYNSKKKYYNINLKNLEKSKKFR